MCYVTWFGISSHLLQLLPSATAMKMIFNDLYVQNAQVIQYHISFFFINRNQCAWSIHVWINIRITLFITTRKLCWICFVMFCIYVYGKLFIDKQNAIGKKKKFEWKSNGWTSLNEDWHFWKSTKFNLSLRVPYDLENRSNGWKFANHKIQLKSFYFFKFDTLVTLLIITAKTT